MAKPAPAPPRAKEELGKLLATSTSTGAYCTGEELPANVPVPVIRLKDKQGGRISEAEPLQFPLSAEHIQLIQSKAERATVGLVDRTAVDLSVRKTWQIKPSSGLLDIHQRSIQPLLDRMVAQVSRELGTDSFYQVEAHLYKFLLYEPGCFFRRHRDTERLEGMFGTLVLELPSVYTGADLNIWSPLTPHQKTTFAYGNTTDSQNKKKKQKMMKQNTMKFTAFYADCYHEVTELKQGHRAVLIYHLTARPLQNAAAIAPLPPQPADKSVAIRISHLMKQFEEELDQVYSKVEKEDKKEYEYEGHYWRKEKPKKLVLILSHHYTPLALEQDGWKALKGTDRSIAELIRAAANVPPPIDLTAEGTTNSSQSDDGPYFDAYLSLAILFDFAEPTEGEESCTTGPSYSLTGNNNALPFPVGPPISLDLHAAYHPSWFEGGEAYWGPVEEWDDPDPEDLRLWEENKESYGSMHMHTARPGSRSVRLMNHELVFADETRAAQFKEQLDKDGHGGGELFVPTYGEGVKAVEFVGNGTPYEGRVYSRAVILLWPKSHRSKVKLQTTEIDPESELDE